MQSDREAGPVGVKTGNGVSGIGDRDVQGLVGGEQSINFLSNAHRVV
jgi:hypothetical protein